MSKRLGLAALAIFSLWAPTCSCIETQIRAPQEEFPYVGPADELDLEHQTDILSQEYRPVDLLLVVDNSCSMGDDQAKLLSFIPTVTAPLENYMVDYHVGVTTTDGDVNEATGIIHWLARNSVSNLTLELTPLVQVGVSGSGIEQGSKALSAALHRQVNQGFFRPNSPLEIILVSDEFDSSTERVKNLLVYRAIDEMVQMGKDVRIHTITANHPGQILPNATFCWAPHTSDYLDLSAATGGMQVDICADDWSPVMEKVAENMLQFQDTFPLSRIPQGEGEDIHVMVETDCCVTDPFDQYPDAWTYDVNLNAVVFRDYPLDIIRRVVIDYTIAQ